MIKNIENINKELNDLDLLFNKGDYDSVILKSKELIIKFNKVIPIYNYLALSYHNKNQFDLAINVFNKAFEIDSNDITIIINLANTYISSGDFNLAIKFTKLANKIAPENLGVDFTLSNLIDYSKDKDHQLSMLKKTNDKKFNEKNKIPLYFALGKSFSDQKNFSKSFEFYKLGNEAKNSTLKNYSLEIEEIYLNKIKEFFLNFDFNTYKNKKLYDKKIIFIVGLPRSGTSLVHQILASHENMKGLGESKILNGFFNHKILDKNFIKKLDQNDKINTELLSEISTILGSLYEKNSEKKIVIDKSPFNFFWIGFIKLIFPNAKIIHISRNIEDTCLSIYKSLFGTNGVLWSYNKINIIKFVKIYDYLINYWSKKIPNYIYEINYETLVNNQEFESKKLIKFCELEWQDKCLSFYENVPTIKSASLYQTRKPIYKSSIKQNLNYNKYINFTEVTKK